MDVMNNNDMIREDENQTRRVSFYGVKEIMECLKCKERKGRVSGAFSSKDVKETFKGRRALTTNYLEIRCGTFHGDYLYLDLTGRIVEETLGRRLDDDDLPTICKFLLENKKVIYLSLGYNLITEKGFSVLAFYLADDSSLQTLNLCQNEICAINEHVVRNTAALWKVKCLLLRGNKLGANGGVAIAHLLRFNVSLVHLDIGETDQTVQSLSHIVQSLLAHLDGNRTLQKIHFNRLLPGSRQGVQYSFHICRLVEQVLYHNRTLVELHLEKNDISDWDLEIFLPALKTNLVLELINLTGNRLTSRGLELLSAVLPFTRIQYLMVSANRIGNEGAIALGRIFSKTKIRYLDVSHNKIGDIGMINLLWGLKAQIPPVHTFFLFGNPITEESTTILLRQINIGHVSPFALDIRFTSSKDHISSFSEDVTANKYRNIYYFVHELSSYKRPLHHSCCYTFTPSITNEQTIETLHLPYRKLPPPKKVV